MAGHFPLSLGSIGLRGVGLAVEPACPTHLSRAVLRCFGLFGYDSYWDSLVPAWTVPASFTVGICLAIVLSRLTWIIRGRWRGSLSTSSVEVLAHSAIELENGIGSNELDIPRRGQSVSQLRRGRGALA